MSSADQCLREGNLQEALKAIQKDIRQNPTNSSYRFFLFQLLVIRGDWQRALTQLEALSELGGQDESVLIAYRMAIQCEAKRNDVFSGRETPLVLGAPPQWLALMLEALRLDAQGHFVQAAELRNSAFSQADALPGQIDEQDFQWLADADPRLGPILEVIVNGNYHWVPLERIREIHLSKPEHLVDLVWLPARFVWTNNGELSGLILVRYPGSEKSDDADLALARKTIWQQVDENCFIGFGQRILTSNDEDYPLLDVRKIVFEQKTGM